MSAYPACALPTAHLRRSLVDCSSATSRGRTAAARRFQYRSPIEIDKDINPSLTPLPMSAPEIHAKLESFLVHHSVPTEECHVVYLLVELRKIMDQLGARRAFSLVRFYADWSVHSQKDRVTPEIERVAETIYTEVAASAASAPAARAFAQMVDLRGELTQLLQAIRVNPALTVDDEKWESFVSLLTAILADQPIVNPSTHVNEIRFEPHSQQCVITFAQPAGGHSSHRQTRA